MNEPGVFTLGDFTLGAAANVVGEPVVDLDGMIGAAVQATYAPEGGDVDATVACYFQSSLDQGSRWFDLGVLRFDGQTAATRYLNFAASETSTPLPLIPTDGALDDDSNGVIAETIILGDRLRVRVISTGVYTGASLLAVRVCVR